MKKFFAFIAVCVLSLFTLVSCGNKAASLKTNLENNGYTVKELKVESSALKSVYFVEKDIEFSCYFELASKDEMEAGLTELKKNNMVSIILSKYGEDAKEIAAEIEKQGLLKDNLIFLTVDDEEAKKIFAAL